MRTDQRNFKPTYFTNPDLSWPSAFGVFTHNIVSGLPYLVATFVYEADAKQYILANGLRAVAWVAHI